MIRNAPPALATETAAPFVYRGIQVYVNPAGQFWFVHPKGQIIDGACEPEIRAEIDIVHAVLNVSRCTFDVDAIMEAIR